jgi:hypothetical protein
MYLMVENVPDAACEDSLLLLQRRLLLLLS